MKKNVQVKVLFLTIISIILITSCCTNQTKNEESFSFVFMSDIHLQEELNAIEGFKKAIDTINKINPDFVITGGDLIMDALDVSYDDAIAAFNLYKDVSQKINAPVYNTMGNHDIFGVYSDDEKILYHPEYGEKMFENILGPSYQSFTHKGWKFMILNTVEETENKKYHGLIDSTQVSWIEEELSKTDSEIPIVISTHFPFISAYNQWSQERTVASSSSWIIKNGKEVLELFKNHNLKLVLQGHLHIQEYIEINGVHFITGGSIASDWWEGSYEGFEEGFLKLTVYDNEFEYEFVDYNWNAKK